MIFVHPYKNQVKIWRLYLINQENYTRCTKKKIDDGEENTTHSRQRRSIRSDLEHLQ